MPAKVSPDTHTHTTGRLLYTATKVVGIYSGLTFSLYVVLIIINNDNNNHIYIALSVVNSEALAAGHSKLVVCKCVRKQQRL